MVEITFEHYDRVYNLIDKAVRKNKYSFVANHMCPKTKDFIAI